MSSIGSYQAVIFDMDGVIVDSEPRHERAFLAVLDQIGLTGKHSLRFEDYIGRTDHVLWQDFVATHQTSQTLEELRDLKRRKVVEILRAERPLFDGIPELIRELAKQVPLGLASGSERLIVDEVLALGGLQPLFRSIVTGSEVCNGKPEPDIFLRVASELGVVPGDCVVIEDSLPGVAAGLAAGMRVVCLPHTHSAGELGAATLVVENVAQLREVLVER